MTKDELEAVFLNSDDPTVEKIQASRSLAEGLGRAYPWLYKKEVLDDGLKSCKPLKFDPCDLITVVVKFKDNA